MNNITKSVLAGGTISAARFVALSGGLCVQASAPSDEIIGICERACVSGEICEVTVIGFARLAFAGVVAPGGVIKSDLDGKGVAGTTGVNAHARYIGQTSSTDATIPSTASGDLKEVLIINPSITLP